MFVIKKCFLIFFFLLIIFPSARSHTHTHTHTHTHLRTHTHTHTHTRPIYLSTCPCLSSCVSLLRLHQCFSLAYMHTNTQICLYLCVIASPSYVFHVLWYVVCGSETITCMSGCTRVSRHDNKWPQ